MGSLLSLEVINENFRAKTVDAEGGQRRLERLQTWILYSPWRAKIHQCGEKYAGCRSSDRTDWTSGFSNHQRQANKAAGVEHGSKDFEGVYSNLLVKFYTVLE